ncbi:MAG: hypothetical protein RIQ93_3521 [Verrucomicrobiota bacterium]|jgi:hypothetical protein
MLHPFEESAPKGAPGYDLNQQQEKRLSFLHCDWQTLLSRIKVIPYTRFNANPF